MKNAIICFTRIPLPGQTKTRLQPFLNGAECAALHSAFLRDIAAVCESVEADLFVAYTPAIGSSLLAGLFPPRTRFFSQVEADLGTRMDQALRRVLAQSYDACILIGSDLPLLGAAQLRSAFAALERADATLGPTPDGGYYLVGLRSPCSELFAKQTYGCPTVYEHAVAALRAAGRSFSPALPCSDVDTVEDLRALRAALYGQDSCTARCLRALPERRDPA